MDVLGIVIAIVVGLVIGVLSGILGIGGGTVMVPVFKLGFGLTAIGATATSLFAIIPTSVSGAITHLRQKTCIPKLGVFAGVAGACMSPVGVLLASMSPGWAIMLAAAIVIAYSSFTMLKKALKAPKSKPRSGKTSAKPVPEVLPDVDLGKKVYLGLPIGAMAGLVAGYVGVGGGFLMVPMFLSLLELDMKRASGSSLVAIGILCIPGAILQIIYGNVAIVIAIALVAGSIPGAVLGAKAAKYIPERELRFAFAGVLFVAAVLLVAQELGLF
ncbi:MAG: sulfite exporter TauE/SafE family protein [Coriobacteriia bacterium]|nr:sulfite exporter TauE/SafE family protein [Coriobacteriia bacterium]